jgi:CheY-like chemotaxis protein
MSVTKVDGTGKRILVIDDDLAIRVLLKAVLQRMHFDVDLAPDGAAGLEKLQGDGRFDLVLLDLMMPKVNGYEFLDRLDGVVDGNRPHVIVFTAAGKRGVDKIPKDAICNSILKPFDLERFVEMIDECIHRDHAH